MSDRGSEFRDGYHEGMRDALRSLLDPARVEAAARALCESRDLDWHEEGELGEIERASCREQSRIALAAAITELVQLHELESSRQAKPRRAFAPSPQPRLAT